MAILDALDCPGKSRRMMFSELPIAVNPDKWDLGCATDEVRNGFVVPYLSRLIEAVGAESVADVGCGSGYITRQLGAMANHAGREWLLIDRDEGAIEYVRARFLNGRSRFVAQDLVQYADATHAARVDLAFCAYTLLEVADLQDFATALKRLVPRGTISVFVPDVFEDMLESTKRTGSGPLRGEFGAHLLHKRDSFTNEVQTFIARQAIEYVAAFLDDRTHLTELVAHSSRGGGRHFALTFSRG